jgi:hypothetical protein
MSTSAKVQAYLAFAVALIALAGPQLAGDLAQLGLPTWARYVTMIAGLAGAVKLARSQAIMGGAK